MADKIKRVLLLFWHMIWPLLLYEATGTLVRSELALLFPEKEPEQLALPAMLVTAGQRMRSSFWQSGCILLLPDECAVRMM